MNNHNLVRIFTYIFLFINLLQIVSCDNFKDSQYNNHHQHNYQHNSFDFLLQQQQQQLKQLEQTTPIYNNNNIDNFNKILICTNQIPDEWQSDLYRGDLENGWKKGWSNLSESAIISQFNGSNDFDYSASLPENNVAYEGVAYALFQNQSHLLESLPIKFANINYTTIYNQHLLRFYLQINQINNTNNNSSSSDNNQNYNNNNSNNNNYNDDIDQPILTIKLNDSIIGELFPSNYSLDQYHLVTINVTQFANGSTYILRFNYKPSTLKNQLQTYQFIVDYISLVSVPTVLIENDIYVSTVGNDISGSGSIDNPFCSLQRAIASISSGYTIYLNDTYPLYKANKATVYAMDNLSKNLTVTSLGETEQSIAIGFTYPMMIVTGPNTTLKFSYLRLEDGISYNYRQAAIFTLGPDTAIELNAIKQFMGDGVNATVISTHFTCRVAIYNSSFLLNMASVFYLRAYSASFDNCTITSSNFGYIFIAINQNLNLTISNTIFETTSNVFLGVAFDSISVANATFDQVWTDDEVPDTIDNGNSIEFINCTFNQTIYRIMLHNIKNVLFESSVFYQLKAPGIIALNEGIGITTISKSLFTSIPQTTTLIPLISIQTNSYFPVTLVDTIFINNSCPLINIINNSSLIMHNITISNNTKVASLISSSSSSITMTQSTILNNQSPLLSSFMSLIKIVGCIVSKNYCPDYLPSPFMIFQQPLSVEISRTQFDTNNNFHLIKIENGLRVSMVSLQFYFCNIGQMITIIDNSIATLVNIQTFGLFLATTFPIVVESSQITLSESYFQSSTQAISLINSRFNLHNSVWDNIYSTDNRQLKTFNIVGSNGTFLDCVYNSSNPSGGIFAKDSSVTIVGTTFMDLASYQYSVGSINYSNFLFKHCKFQNIQTGEIMMYFRQSSAEFDNCIFSNITSPYTNIMAGLRSIIRIYNCEIFNTQSDLTGIDMISSHLYLVNSTIYSNIYLFYPFISVIDSGKLYINNVRYHQNQGTIKTGAATARIINSLFTENIQDEVLIDVTYTKLKMENTTFVDNGTPHQPSLIHGVFSSIEIIDSEFRAEIFDNIISVLSTSQGSLLIRNSTFKSLLLSSSLLILNKTTPIDIVGSSFFDMEGASGTIALFANCDQVVISDCQFKNNYANRVAAPGSHILYTEYPNSGGVFLVVNSVLWAINNIFKQNYASNSGGIITNIDSTSLFANSLFEENQVIVGSGAVCFTNQPTCYIGNCTDLNPCTYTPILKNRFIDNSVINGYGKYISSSPVGMSITLLNYDKIHPNTSFIIAVSEYDYYEQSILLLSSPISITLDLYLANGIRFQTFTIPSTLQGFFTQTFTLDLPVGTELNFVANSTNGFIGTFSINITQCEPGYMPSPNDNACTQCPTGSYGWDGKSCYSCKYYQTSQVICAGGTQISAMAGWWILPDSYPAKVYGCEPYICQLGKCREHQTGTLCNDCVSGYTKVKVYCEYCPDNINYYLVSGLVVFFFIYILLMTLYRLPSATAILNFLNCIQVVGVISFDIRYVLILPLFNFDVDYYPTTCLSNQLNYIWKKALSFVLLFLVTTLCSYLTIGKDLALAIFGRFSHYIVENRFNNEWFYIVFSQILTIYTPLAFISLSLVSCYKIGDEYVLSTDVSVKCFTNTHYPMFGIAIAVIVFILIGAPLFIFVQWRRQNRYYLKNFCKKYRPGFQFWDLILIARSLCFVCTTITTIYHINTKALILSTFGLFFTCINWLFSPYKEKSLNDLETHFGLVLCICAMVFNSRALDNSSFSVGAIISSIGFLCVLSMLYYLFSNIRSKRAGVSMIKDWGIQNERSNHRK
ncbi:hypothetical protein PPL_12535 [Heterostelium album PN500]|uniref:Transmembrane protein n=1 Tax=Heterostelium pallidum (strain ATCC 26659 / Pp 5 / PN500) TaxID=670386 RepID=D3BMW2_HETP5|nr:hypothetical protein PPL_12535 [Heterostelium album PN500]EFA77324.1 hypothetical protein PPL_12535 [Heterostelium album PN500]|eukprot:XP_020429453.1 hypothetical protein PPL_12535 [Heterostelium album PN500]